MRVQWVNFNAGVLAFRVAVFSPYFHIACQEGACGARACFVLVELSLCCISIRPLMLQSFCPSCPPSNIDYSHKLAKHCPGLHHGLLRSATDPDRLRCAGGCDEYTALCESLCMVCSCMCAYAESAGRFACMQRWMMYPCMLACMLACIHACVYTYRYVCVHRCTRTFTGGSWSIRCVLRVLGPIKIENLLETFTCTGQSSAKKRNQENLPQPHTSQTVGAGQGPSASSGTSPLHQEDLSRPLSCFSDLQAFQSASASFEEARASTTTVFNYLSFSGIGAPMSFLLLPNLPGFPSVAGAVPGLSSRSSSPLQGIPGSGI